MEQDIGGEEDLIPIFSHWLDKNTWGGEEQRTVGLSPPHSPPSQNAEMSVGTSTVVRIEQGPLKLDWVPFGTASPR